MIGDEFAIVNKRSLCLSGSIQRCPFNTLLPAPFFLQVPKVKLIRHNLVTPIGLAGEEEGSSSDACRCCWGAKGSRVGQM